MIDIEIRSTDYWCKVVDFLQQNWALVEQDDDGEGCTVFFIGDRSGVFDRLSFLDAREAQRALSRNGFRRYEGDPSLHATVTPPVAPFHSESHPNGPIYSSGRFWK